MWVMYDTYDNECYNMVPYNLLYALPTGTGISITQNTWVLENGLEKISSKYILTAAQGPVSDMLKNAGCFLLQEENMVDLFINPKYGDGRQQ